MDRSGYFGCSSESESIASYVCLRLSQAPWSFTPFSGFWKTVCCRVSKGGQCIQAPVHPVTIPPSESSRAIEASLIRWVFHQLRHKARILRQPGRTLDVIGTTSSRYQFHLPSPGRVLLSSISPMGRVLLPTYSPAHREMYVGFRESLALPPGRPLTRPTRFRSVSGI